MRTYQTSSSRANRGGKESLDEDLFSWLIRRHLTHLYILKPFWVKHDRFWVKFDKEDAKSLLKGERMIPCYYPTNRSLKGLIINTRLAWKVLRKEKPDFIISAGVAVAIPFF